MDAVIRLVCWSPSTAATRWTWTRGNWTRPGSNGSSPRAAAFAGTAPSTASQTLTGALALWAGPALAGVEQRFARDTARRLDELRVDSAELRAEVDLGLGRHHEVVADLETLAARHPLRERLCAQLMVAL